MRLKSILRVVLIIAVIGGVSGAAAYTTRKHWQPLLGMAKDQPAESQAAPPPIQEAKVLKMTAQARANLSLVSKPLKVQKYVRSVQVPGEIEDRPGVSDRGVTSPAVGIVVQVHAFPGDTVRPGDKLFTLRLYSEYLQNSQSELFKAVKEIQLIEEQKGRLETLAKSGTLAGERIKELEQNIRREQTVIQTRQQDLLTRGLTPEHIEGIREGKFTSTIDVVAPPADALGSNGPKQDEGTQPPNTQTPRLAYEVQELKVELGQQVQAGELLSILANHQSLYLVGHAFKQDSHFLEQAAQKAWPVQVEFAEDDATTWPDLKQTFEIHHLSNTVDETNRTFDFFLPLINQARTYQKSGKTYVVWRFRPGQRVRLHVPVEEFDNVIVIPAAAVVREGPEAYVFRQNGDLFDRLPVHILHEDRRNIVLANDGSVRPGLYVAQSSASSLNRVLKAQAASGIRADVHVHADGTVHASH